MFTGLIEEVGKVKSITNNELSIYCTNILNDSKIGDSISINGTCLSITGIKSNYLNFHISPTTAMHTRFKSGDLHSGENVNLERALTPATRLGGHIVTGHIDGKAEIISIKKDNEDFYIEFYYPEKIKNLIVDKGSIAIDGISLTISKTLSKSFVVTVIPHTLKNTNLKSKKIGDMVHIEADLFARYIYNILLKGEIDDKNQTVIKKFCRW